MLVEQIRITLQAIDRFDQEIAALAPTLPDYKLFSNLPGAGQALISTFFFRVMGDSMTGANIHDGDLLVVDRSIEPRHGHIVLAVINNEYTIKRLYSLDGTVELHAENPAYPPLCFQEHDELQVWGVVIGAVSRFPV